jgi:GNAT superfamily N-acetyltransferase
VTAFKDSASGATDAGATADREGVVDETSLGDDAGELLLHASAARSADEHVREMLAGGVTPRADVDAWCERGRLYALRSVLDPDPPHAIALVLLAPHAWSAELRSVVVGPSHRRHGLAHRLLLGIADDLRRNGCQLVVTAVPPARLEWFGPLLDVGFAAIGATGPGEPSSVPADPRVGDAHWLGLVL